MSLDVNLAKRIYTTVYSANITHNLTTMADKAGIYECLWHPDKHKIKKAKQLIKPLTAGLAKLRKDPEYYKTFDCSNGWGTYDDFVPWVQSYLNACIENPDADITVSR